MTSNRPNYLIALIYVFQRNSFQTELHYQEKGRIVYRKLQDFSNIIYNCIGRSKFNKNYLFA